MTATRTKKFEQGAVVHDLKTWPESFTALLDGTKTYEIRKADRPFAVGDVLRLREWIPTGNFRGHTGREVVRRVTYLTPGGAWGLPADLCVMALALPEDEPAPRPEEWAEIQKSAVFIVGHVGWDAEGATCPHKSFEWETVGRMALDLLADVVARAPMRKPLPFVPVPRAPAPSAPTTATTNPNGPVPECHGPCHTCPESTLGGCKAIAREQERLRAARTTRGEATRERFGERGRPVTGNPVPTAMPRTVGVGHDRREPTGSVSGHVAEPKTSPGGSPVAGTPLSDSSPPASPGGIAAPCANPYHLDGGCAGRESECYALRAGRVGGDR
jgi:hypothetical protein